VKPGCTIPIKHLVGIVVAGVVMWFIVGSIVWRLFR